MRRKGCGCNYAREERKLRAELSREIRAARCSSMERDTSEYVKKRSLWKTTVISMSCKKNFSTRRSWYHMVLKRDGNEGCKAISAISSVPSFEKTNVKQDVWAKVPLTRKRTTTSHKGDFFFSEINSAALVHCCKSQRGLRGDFSPLKSNHTLELAGIFRPALTSIGCSHLSKRTLGFFWGCNLF